MIDVVSVEEIRAIEKFETENNTSSVELILRVADKIFSSYDFKNYTAIICGTGNNGSDGYALALLLKNSGHNCDVFILKNKFSEEGKYFYEQCLKNNINCRFLSEDVNFNKYDTIVDCIFGIGFHGVVDEFTAKIIEKINLSDAYTISVDINSGLNGNNGLATNACVKSDLTLSVGCLKSGHFLNSAKDYVGKLINLDIGFCPKSSFELTELKDFSNFVKPRKNLSNKGNFGYVAILGGCIQYSGAIKLSALAALRAGCGVSKLIIPENIYCSVAPYIDVATIATIGATSGYMNFDKRQIDDALYNIRALAIGMGWGKGEDNNKILKYILENYNIPVVIDADGLNTLASDTEILKNAKSKIIVTPHIKEFSRLIGKSVSDITENPIYYAERFARDYGVIVVLKGPTTIVTDGRKVYLCNCGVAGMATAGSGDVLSGILVGVLGQNFEDLLLSAAYAVNINGLAGELAQNKYTDIAMIAKDTIEFIPAAITLCRENSYI